MFFRPFPLAFTAVVLYLTFFGGVPGFRDGVHYYGPLFQYVFEELAAGRLPLWNPYENLGQPLAANPTTMLFYPGLWLAGIPTPFGVSAATMYALFTAGHLLLALTTAYRLARSWRCSRAAATLAALGYALGGNVLFQWNNVPFLVGAAWFPEALLRVDRVFRVGTLRSAIGFSVVLALMILGGDPQAAYHAVLCSFVLFLSKSRERSAAKFPGISFKTLALFPLSGLLAFLLAAVQILPAWELGRLSDRSLPAHQKATGLFSVPPWRFLEFFWPGAGGWQFPVNARWFSALPHDHEIWVPSFYQGFLSAILVLLVYGSFRQSMKRKRFLPVQVIFWTFSLGSLGTWFVVYPMLGFLPGYGTFRFPAKLLTVASLMFALTAGFGFDRILRDENTLDRLKTIGRVFLVCVAIVMLAVLWLPLDVFRDVPACPLFGPFDETVARDGLWFSLLTVSGFYLLFEITTLKRIRPNVVLLLLFVDLVAANTWMLTVKPLSEKTERSPLLVEMEAPTRIYRTPTWYPPEFETVSSPGRLTEARRWERDSLFPRYPLPERLAVTDVRGTLMPKNYYPLAGRIRSEWKYGERGEFEKNLERLGVLYVVAPKDTVLDADPVEPKADWPEDVSFWKLRNPRRFEYTVYEPNRLVFDVRLSQPETVVLPEQFWPGWRAFVENGDVPVRCVDEIFRGVDLPAGNHRVTMIYDPPLFKLGLFLSVTGLATVILLSLLNPLRQGSKIDVV